MRVNVEDDLWTSGRLSKLARTLKVSEKEALGQLIGVWRRTQQAGVVKESIDRVVTIIVIDFESDDEARHFLSAMATARLAHRDETSITIAGNGRRIDELNEWYAGKVLGGKARAKQRKDQQIREQDLADAQQNLAGAQQKVAVFSLLSSVLSLKSEENTNTGDRDLAIPQAEVAQKKKRTGRSPEEQARAKQVRDAFWAGCIERYGKPPDEWGAPENGHVYHLLKSSSADVLTTKARAYFRWHHPDVIKAGHPFMGHKWSFSATRSELGADLTNPERRKVAAVATQTMRDADSVAAHEGQAERIARRYLEEQHASSTNALAGRGDEAREPNRITGALSQQALVGRSQRPLVSNADAIFRDIARAGDDGGEK